MIMHGGAAALGIVVGWITSRLDAPSLHKVSVIAAVSKYLYPTQSKGYLSIFLWLLL